MPRRVFGSIPVLGSSRKETAGSETIESATDSLRLFPPEYVLTRASAFKLRPMSWSVRLTTCFRADSGTPRICANICSVSLAVRSENTSSLSNNTLGT